jgi:hypothetical protein
MDEHITLYIISHKCSGTLFYGIYIFFIQMDKIFFQLLLKQVFILDRLNKMKFAGLFSVYMFPNLEFNQNIISIFANETWTDKTWHLYNTYISLTH